MKFELTILGSSSALPTSGRNLTAHVLNVYERLFLIDCGEGTQIQLRRNKIKFGKINHIFISHLHGDHFYGLFGLISSFNLLDRKKDLHIYAHKPLKKGIDFIRKNFEGSLNYTIHFHPVNPDEKELIFEDKRVKVYSFPLKHKIPASGFLFAEKPRLPNIKKSYVEKYNISVKNIRQIKNGGDYTKPDGRIIPHTEITEPPYRQRSYAFCSDTAYNEEILPVINNVDLLYHEATFQEEHKEEADKTLHSTAGQAAEIARKSQAKKLIVGHFSARYKNIDHLINEAKEIFRETIPAEDGMVYEIKPYRIKRSHSSG
ncbi:MAG: ribonuclease Z [Bacteroidales bacterium]|nr:ribonuclease Z [Bacteroidales bacterium]MBS3773698.1 ribonuclease Z [Bacteroidales bacterium]